MFVIIETGGKQYKIEEGDEVVVEKITGKNGDKVSFPQVVFAGKNGKVITDEKRLGKVKVEGEIVEHFLGDKVIAFKYKPKKRYRRKKGHRQNLTKVKINKIEFSGKKAVDEEKKKPVKKMVKKVAAKKITVKKETTKKKTTAKKPVTKKIAPKKTTAKKPTAKKSTTKKVIKKSASAKTGKKKEA